MSRFKAFIEGVNALKILNYPTATPLLIGLNLPTVFGEKKYNELPLVILFPALYTGYNIGNHYYKYTLLFKEEEEEEKEKQKSKSKIFW
jgi:hypothetical protein